MGFDPDALAALFAGAFLIVFIVVLIIGILLQLWFLKVGIRAANGSNLEVVFGTWLVGVLCNFIPCGCILYWVVINSRHKTGFGGAILAWIIAGLLPYLIMGAIMALCIAFIPGMPTWQEILNAIPYI